MSSVRNRLFCKWYKEYNNGDGNKVAHVKALLGLLAAGSEFQAVPESDLEEHL